MKNNNIIISVYITNRNYGNFLEKAIKSYLNQTFKEKELIIVDDSSKDNSKKIINYYKNIYGHIQKVVDLVASQNA